MKYLIGLIFACLLFASCQKKIDIPADSGSINGDFVENNNGVFVEPCHSTSFVTNYPVQAGKVPPFRFTKTHYASGRVKTFNMLSRANPIHPSFKPQAWEVIGTFTYDGKNKAFLKGTKQLWEYYKNSAGAAARKSIMKKDINLTFTFGLGEPYDGTEIGEVTQVYNNIQRATALRLNHNASVGYPFVIQVLSGSDEPDNYFEVWSSEFYGERQPGLRISSINTERGTQSSWSLRKTITFKFKQDRSETNVNRVYQPTQNWISLEYTICEIMGWVGFGLDGIGSGSERTSVEVRFYPYSTSYLAVQSQHYRNHKYDGRGNLLSYTYSDGVLQKTSWVCK